MTRSIKRRLKSLTRGKLCFEQYPHFRIHYSSFPIQNYCAVIKQNQFSNGLFFSQNGDGKTRYSGENGRPSLRNSQLFTRLSCFLTAGQVTFLFTLSGINEGEPSANLGKVKVRHPVENSFIVSFDLWFPGCQGTGYSRVKA